jgi:hypothetical protein
VNTVCQQPMPTMTSEPNVRDDMNAYEAVSAELQAAHLGKWVVFYNRELAGIFESFETAAENAVSRFGKGPYLIRRVGAHSVTLPASVMFGALHAVDPLRV